MSDWSEHTSKNYLRPYWFNKKTGQSTWKKPQEVIEYEEKKETKRKEKEEQRKIWKQREAEFLREHMERRAEREKAEKEREKESYGMQIVNSNGMSWTIEGGAHWTKEDYLEELRNYNQAMRDF